MKTLLVLTCLALSSCAVEYPSPTSSPVQPLFWGEGWACSSVVMGEHTVYTARHCIPQIGEIKVHVQGVPHVPSYVVPHPDRDIAVLYFSEVLPGPYAEVGGRPGPLQHVYIEGYGCRDFPNQKGPVFGQRTLVFLARIPVEGLIFGGVACKGDSGGGVFNEDGQLIGITYAIGRLTNQGPIVFVTDVDYAQDLI